jgi:tRNA-splicing endonuclease subunit Sen34
MASSSEQYSPKLPFPIICISSKVAKYILYDIDLITWLRKEHHILGTLLGSLPQAPSQNVFLGLPLQLMPEEARLLIEKGLAYVIYDHEQHVINSRKPVIHHVSAYKDHLTRSGLEAAETAQTQKEVVKQEVLKKSISKEGSAENYNLSADKGSKFIPTEEPSLFDSSVTEPLGNVPKKFSNELQPWSLTPVSAYPLFTLSNPANGHIPKVNPAAYALYKLLHEEGYYMSPGLRFGCQYTAYPGDPLRFHSHFLATGQGWDDKLDLIDIVGGGRLGTGVKKAFLMGGISPTEEAKNNTEAKAFSIEWAGM